MCRKAGRHVACAHPSNNGDIYIGEYGDDDNDDDEEEESTGCVEKQEGTLPAHILSRERERHLTPRALARGLGTTVLV